MGKRWSVPLTLRFPGFPTQNTWILEHFPIAILAIVTPFLIAKQPTNRYSLYKTNWVKEQCLLAQASTGAFVNLHLCIWENVCNLCLKAPLFHDFISRCFQQSTNVPVGRAGWVAWHWEIIAGRASISKRVHEHSHNLQLRLLSACQRISSVF